MGKELLFSVTKKDLDISWHCTPGPGGQKKNKTQNACRILHRDSGAVGQASERRERHANLKTAFRRMAENPKFKAWWRKRVAEILEGETTEQRIARCMCPENIRTEVLEDDRWVPWRDDDSSGFATSRA